MVSTVEPSDPLDLRPREPLQHRGAVQRALPVLKGTGLLPPPPPAGALTLVLWRRITVCRFALAIKPHSVDVLLIKNLIWAHEEKSELGEGGQRQGRVARPGSCQDTRVIKHSDCSGELNQANICSVATSSIE